MNESFSATVPLTTLLNAVKRYQDSSKPLAAQHNLVVTVDDHGVLTIGPEPVEVVSIPSVERN